MSALVAHSPKRSDEAPAETEVCITVDTEFSIGGAFADPQRYRPLSTELVECRIGGRSEGLGFILQTLKKSGVAATFFVEVLQGCYFGDVPMRQSSSNSLPPTRISSCICTRAGCTSPPTPAGCRSRPIFLRGAIAGRTCADDRVRMRRLRPMGRAGADCSAHRRFQLRPRGARGDATLRLAGRLEHSARGLPPGRPEAAPVQRQRGLRWRARGPGPDLRDAAPVFRLATADNGDHRDLLAGNGDFIVAGAAGRSRPSWC